MQQERFKLDAAAISDTSSPQQRVIVYNFNVPIERAQDRASFELVRQQVETDFPQGVAGTVTSPYFQLSAVYTIVNRETNEERLWLGSFNPRARDLSQLTAFRPFDANSFVQYAVANSEPERVRNKLTNVVNGKDSVWSLGQLLSIIVSVQATIRLNHSLFVQHPQLVHNHGGNKRKVFTTFFD